MKRIALIDGNSFYASVEALFRPDIRDKPVCVLSNGDGCVIARNAKAKELGIPMGAPFFQIKDYAKQNGVQMFSSNYTLYADVSRRMIQSIFPHVEDLEQYSIDECWALMPDVDSLHEYGLALKETVLREVGVPVGMGISTTKTLAKLAQWASKEWKQTGGVVDLTDPVRQHKLLKIAPVAKIWGIGRKLEARLAAMNIVTAWDLATFDHKTLRKSFNVNLERTARELMGEECLHMHESPDLKKEIMKSCMFGVRVHDLAGLQEAAASYASSAAERLRSQRSLCQTLTVSVQTSQHEPQHKRYYNSISVQMINPTDDTRLLIRSALQGLERVFRPGFAYSKCAILLTDLHQRGTYTQDLFAEQQDAATDRLGELMDTINLRYGRNAIHSARVKIDPEWKVRRDLLSPSYTTSWSELPVCR